MRGTSGACEPTALAGGMFQTKTTLPAASAVGSPNVTVE